MTTQNLTLSNSMRVAGSPAVRAKAAAILARGGVRYVGSGRFAVDSASGRSYTVQAPRGERDARRWSCECDWHRFGVGVLCAHVRAAEALLEAVTEAAR